MSTFTLADLRDEVAKKYEPLAISNGDDVFVLQPLLTMGEKQRKRVTELLSKYGDTDGVDFDASLGVASDLVVAVTKDNRGKDLVALLGDNPALVIEVITRWMEATQPGEASS